MPVSKQSVDLNQECSSTSPDDEAPLPEFLRPLFWEVDFDRLRVRGHERYIVERVLEYGDLPEAKWMLERFSRDKIAQALRHSRGLSPKSASFWAFILGVPQEDILCLSTSFRRRPGRIWLR
jgi:hypothetical protein